METASPIKKSREEPRIHFRPTLSAFFSDSLDHGAVLKIISPVLDIEGVDDSAIPAPARSPSPPSSQSASTRVCLQAAPEVKKRIRPSTHVMAPAAIAGRIK